MKLLSSLLFAGLLLSETGGFAQTDSTFINRVNNAIEKQAPIEKVYLHLNKPSYSFSDTIWYKAYTVIGQHHQLSALSGVLYVELISPNDTLVTRQTLKLTSGVAWGDIPLAATLQQGVYRLRAYTKWMRNAGADYFYDQKIRIGGQALNASAASTKPIVQKPDVQFFPEGGELVNGIRSRVAIKAINDKGLGVDVTGVIEDNEGNIVADFATRHLGMGVFAIIPQNGKSYKAKITSTGEAVYTVALPQAKEEGYTLAVNSNHTDSLFLKVAVNDKLLTAKRGSAFYLVAQSAGKIYYSAKSNLSEPVYMAGIDKARFPSGIVQFTLFGYDRQPVAERIAFISNNDSLSLAINADAKVYKLRQQVKISLNAFAKAQPANGTFSVAVINQDTVGVDGDAESTIANTLLLSSDLQGNIERPGYYFGNSPATKADLDLLMLTQGYRKFEWKKTLTANAAAVAYNAESGLEVEGLLKTNSNKPIANGRVSLISTRDNLVVDTVANAAGVFKFTGLDLAVTSKVVIRARNGDKGYNVNVFLKVPMFAPIVKSTPADSVYGQANVSPPVVQALMKAGRQYVAKQKQEQIKHGILLKQVNIKASARKAETPGRENNYGASIADFKIDGKKLGSSNLSMGLQLSLPFVSYKNGKFRQIKPPFAQHHILIDGTEVEPDQLKMYDVADIDNVKMSANNFDKLFYGVQDTPEIGGDLIIVTTKMHAGTRNPAVRSHQKEITMPDSNKYITNDPPSGLMGFTAKGFTPTRSFYTPKYTAATPLPDLRSTIYWNPNIITDKQGSATIEYLNNDTKGTYRIVVEGIDDSGNLGRMAYKYKVE